MKKQIINYDIIVEYDDNSQILRNSFVDEPAVEYTKFSFSKEVMKFSKIDTHQKFMSVSILADVPIGRLDKATGEEFTVTFGKNAIEKLVNKRAIQGKTNDVSYQHNDNKEIMPGIFLVENFISQKGRVTSPLFDVPDGSLIDIYWVKDKKQYEDLLNDSKFNGFSIELTAKIEESFCNDFKAIYDEERTYNEIEVLLSDETLSDELKYNKIKSLLAKY